MKVDTRYNKHEPRPVELECAECETTIQNTKYYEREQLGLFNSTLDVVCTQCAVAEEL